VENKIHTISEKFLKGFLRKTSFKKFSLREKKGNNNENYF